MNTINTVPVPTPWTSLIIPSRANLTAQQGPRRAFPEVDRLAALRAYHAKRAGWAKLSLLQTWADEDHMREHIKAAGLKVRDNNEPATVARLKALLRRAEVLGPQIEASVGTDLEGFLRLNPSLPLWAALALVLEACSA